MSDDDERRKQEIAFRRYKEMWEAAAKEPHGVKIYCKDAGQAISYRQKCYQYRMLDRDWNYELYAVDHPMHGTSLYDDYEIVIAEGDPRTLIIRPVTPPKIEPIE